MKSTNKFRGKHRIQKHWIYGSLMEYKNGDCFIFPFDGYDSPDNYEVNPETVGQFTGLNDLEGKEIYFDDFLKYDKGDSNYLVDYRNGCTIAIHSPTSRAEEEGECKWDYLYDMLSSGNIGLSGNRHDNPEQLK